MNQWTNIHALRHRQHHFSPSLPLRGAAWQSPPTPYLNHRHRLASKLTLRHRRHRGLNLQGVQERPSTKPTTARELGRARCLLLVHRRARRPQERVFLPGMETHLYTSKLSPLELTRTMVATSFSRTTTAGTLVKPGVVLPKNKNQGHPTDVCRRPTPITFLDHIQGR